MTLLIIAVIGAYLMALGAIVCTIHLSVVYQRFNDGIKDWAKSLDESTRAAIDRQAIEILRELDSRISSVRSDETDVETDVNLLNIENNE